jgi:cell division protein FtsQ
MARKQAAQLDLELPEEEPVEQPPEPPAPKRARAKPEERSTGRRRFRRVLIWTGVGVAALGAIVGAYQVDQFLASDPHFILPGAATAKENPNFTIEGLVYAPRAEVLRVFERDFGRSVYLLPLDGRRSSLMAIDWVRDAAVARRWPNRVAVRLTERKPVAFVMLPRTAAAGSAISEAALIDGEGVVLRPPPRAQFSLPVLAGITRRDSPEARRARVQQVKELLDQVRGYSGQISEIDVSDPDNIAVTEVVQGRAVRLLLGNQNFPSRLNNFMSHYPDISRRLPHARTFDLRLDDHITARDGGTNGR